MEKETKTILLLVSALILLVGNLIFLSSYAPVTGNSVRELPLEEYSFTKAICERNVCQDYEITCKNEQLVYQKPVSERVYFPENWVDNRIEKDKQELC